ncbi:MAG: hypothetical protein NVSMB25_01260 [Thermoleophilaceae bacterium]
MGNEMIKSSMATALAVGVAVALGACGSSKSSTTNSSPAPPPAAPQAGAAGGTVALAADPGGQLKFDKQQASATAGAVTIKFQNPSAVDHGVSIEGNGVDREGKVVGKGASTTLTLNLKAGTYTFYCPVPGHRQAGMQGTLTVR